MNPNNNTLYEYPSWDPMVKLVREMRIRKLSQKTIKSYLYYITKILNFTSKNPKEINGEDVKNYLEHLVKKDLSASTINSAYSALLFYFSKILNRKFFVKIPRAKRDKKLPIILSKEEIFKIINSGDNIKHKLMIQILYSSGLRVSELINLQIDSIDFNRKTILIKGAKGAKDRITITSETVLKNINKYLLEYKPLRYVFESRQVGKKLSTRSINCVVDNLTKKTGIKKIVSPHTFRHSFATHLLENNVNIRYIQSLLGHARLETTQIYTKVAIDRFEDINDLL